MTLTGKCIAFLATDGVERVEMVEPRAALEDAGATCLLVSPNRAEIDTYRHFDKIDSVTVDVALEDARIDEFDGLVLPGGVSNPDTLRIEPAAIAFVRSFIDAGKPVAAICHAPWLLVQADRVANRALTSWPSVQTDIVNAGGEWSDRAVVRDGMLVTSRGPDDIPQFIAAVIDLFAGESGADEALDAELDDSFPASDPPSTTTGPSLR